MRIISALAILGFALTTATEAQMRFEEPPINYGQEATENRISKLQQQLDSGNIELKYDSEHGYLPDLLRLLNVPQNSQTLVFSKTSLQLTRINPRRPRAVYFNDDTYVGWVQGGDVIEISTTDPTYGAVFYTLDQRAQQKTRFLRDKGQCLTCHASSRTQGIPGHLVRSVYVDRVGQPLLGSGTFTSDHRSPFVERFGGWYVTGQHGQMRHMGNVLSDRDHPEEIDRESGANLVDLSNRVDVSPYLKATSDLVALMVLEHQTQMHNFITLANFEARSALHYDGIMNEALERPADYRSESFTRRIESVAKKVVKHLLFVDEFQLESPITGVSQFQTSFSQQGSRDHKGRSLREFDLNTRLFKYPCSYLVYDPAFTSLPQPVKDETLEQLRSILESPTAPPGFEHLSDDDRQAIMEILTDTGILTGTSTSSP